MGSVRRSRHLWGAIPVGGASSVPVAGRTPLRLEHGGIAHLIPREIERLETALEETELGRAWVTTPAQTLYDLVMKPNQGGEPQIAREAVDNLIARVTAPELQEIVDQTQRANSGIHNALRRLERPHA